MHKSVGNMPSSNKCCFEMGGKDIPSLETCIDCQKLADDALNDVSDSSKIRIVVSNDPGRLRFRLYV